MLKIGVSTNNESGNGDIEILNNIANAGFKNVLCYNNQHSQLLF